MMQITGCKLRLSPAWPEGSHETLSVARCFKGIRETLMEPVTYRPFYQISHALYEVGGEYRRNT